MPGDASVAYFVALILDEEQTLDAEFEGGKPELKIDMMVPQGHLVRGMNLQGCFRYHIRVPPELLESMPTRIVVKPDEGGYLPDFGFAPWGGWKLVSQAFVNIVERLEPGVHEFLPIAETLDQQGGFVEKRVFLMNILQQFNAVDAEQSSVKINEYHHSSTTDGKKLEFSYQTMQLVEPRRLPSNVLLSLGIIFGTALPKTFITYFSQTHFMMQCVLPVCRRLVIFTRKRFEEPRTE